MTAVRTTTTIEEQLLPPPQLNFGFNKRRCSTVDAVAVVVAAAVVDVVVVAALHSAAAGSSGNPRLSVSVECVLQGLGHPYRMLEDACCWQFHMIFCFGPCCLGPCNKVEAVCVHSRPGLQFLFARPRPAQKISKKLLPISTFCEGGAVVNQYVWHMFPCKRVCTEIQNCKKERNHPRFMCCTYVQSSHSLLLSFSQQHISCSRQTNFCLSLSICSPYSLSLYIPDQIKIWQMPFPPPRLAPAAAAVPSRARKQRHVPVAAALVLSMVVAVAVAAVFTLFCNMQISGHPKSLRQKLWL